jgi:hypothetical protein
MKLVFIHGAPGAGKLTTARALVDRVKGRLFDNHAAIDVARTVIDFGEAGFWELVQEIRLSVLDAAGKSRVPLLVMTFVYVEPDDAATLRSFEEVIERNGDHLLPVFLQCSTEEIVRRIANPDRVARGKMASVEHARDFMQQHRITAVPRSTCLMLDSEAHDAGTNAAIIIRHFGLGTD